MVIMIINISKAFNWLENPTNIRDYFFKINGERVLISGTVNGWIFFMNETYHVTQ